MQKSINPSAPIYGRLAIGPALIRKGAGIALVVLAVMVVPAYGYWGYQKLHRSQELAQLKEQAQVMRQDLASSRLLAQNLAVPEQSIADELQRLNALKGSLLAPGDGIRVVEHLTLLAERTGVFLNTLQLNPAKGEKVGEVSFNTLQLDFTARGSDRALTDFFEALQEGVIPGLVVTEAQTDLTGSPASLTARATLFTLSGQPPRATIPLLLKAGATPAQSLAPRASRPGSTDTPLLGFTVESLFSGMDAFRSIRLQISPSAGSEPALSLPKGQAQPEIFSKLKLYMETSGDTVLTAKDDTLVAVTTLNTGGAASATGDAQGLTEVLLLPETPVTFQGGKEQRFYLAADLSANVNPRSTPLLVQVEIPVGGATFTSGPWPPAALASAFKSNLRIGQPATAQDQPAEVGQAGLP